MTTPSVETDRPPPQASALIASWGARHGTWIEYCGAGEALVSMWVEDERKTVAMIAFSETDDVPTTVEWNDVGKMAVEQFKRDAWDTQFYKEIALWLREAS